MSLDSFMAERTTAEGLLNLLQTFMQAGGLDEYDQEARQILETVLNCDYTGIRAGLVKDPTPEQIESAFKLAARRISGVPIAHLLGFAHFYGFVFKVAQGVLIPRAETEILVKRAVEILGERDWPEPHVLDLFTGCGNILLSIAATISISKGIGIDRDPIAIACANTNLDNFRFDHIEFLHWDVAKLLDGIDRRFHMVTANPPYVPTSEIAGLQPEVSGHENWTALDGGTDGLKYFRMMATRIPNIICPGGCLLSEIGFGQEKAVADIFFSWNHIDFIQDLNGIPRVLIARP